MAGALPARPARGVRLCPVSQLGLLSRLSFILGVECPTAGTAAPTQAFEDEVSVPTWAPATAARSVGPSGGLAEVCRSVSGEGMWTQVPGACRTRTLLEVERGFGEK